jgi:hypothetical protein
MGPQLRSPELDDFVYRLPLRPPVQFLPLTSASGRDIVPHQIGPGLTFLTSSGPTPALACSCVAFASKYLKAIYKRRKETVERSFADVKQLFGHRYARFRGLIKVSCQCLLATAAQNLKKIALALAKPAPLAA